MAISLKSLLYVFYIFLNLTFFSDVVWLDKVNRQLMKEKKKGSNIAFPPWLFRLNLSSTSLFVQPKSSLRSSILGSFDSPLSEGNKRKQDRFSLGCFDYTFPLRFVFVFPLNLTVSFDSFSLIHLTPLRVKETMETGPPFRHGYFA